MLGAELGNGHPANCNPPADKAQRDVLCRARREEGAASCSRRDAVLQAAGSVLRAFQE